jgi:hypothetical protein
MYLPFSNGGKTHDIFSAVSLGRSDTGLQRQRVARLSLSFMGYRPDRAAQSC